MEMEPLSKPADVPVLKTILPLMPAFPALGVPRITSPLVVWSEAPLLIKRLPPGLAEFAVDAILEPDDSTKLPPTPESPDPTVMYIEPPRPVEDAPVPIKRDPLFPDVE
jgi:hypothetical protein